MLKNDELGSLLSLCRSWTRASTKGADSISLDVICKLLMLPTTGLDHVRTKTYPTVPPYEVLDVSLQVENNSPKRRTSSTRTKGQPRQTETSADKDRDRKNGPQRTNADVRFFARVINRNLGNSCDPLHNHVGNVRDNLYRPSKVCSLSLARDDFVIDLASRNVVVAGELNTEISDGAKTISATSYTGSHPRVFRCYLS